MALHRATKTQTTARIALVSVAGCGKTYTALRIAARLAFLRGKKRVALLDCEHGSAEKFAGDPNPDGGVFDFDVEDLTHFAVANYLNPMKEIVKGGEHSVTVVDTVSHAWSHAGGILSIVDGTSGNKFAKGWGAATPQHQKFIEGLAAHPLDLICTIRAKEKFVQEQDDNGKTVIRRLGLEPIQRGTILHDFDLVLYLDTHHTATVVKSRVHGVDIGDTFDKPGADLADILHAWLDDGVSPEERQALINKAKLAVPKTWNADEEKHFLKFLDDIGISIDDLDEFCVLHMQRPMAGAGADLQKLDNFLRDPQGPGRRAFEDWKAKRDAPATE